MKRFMHRIAVLLSAVLVLAVLAGIGPAASAEGGHGCRMRQEPKSEYAVSGHCPKMEALFDMHCGCQFCCGGSWDQQQDRGGSEGIRKYSDGCGRYFEFPDALKPYYGACPFDDAEGYDYGDHSAYGFEPYHADGHRGDGHNGNGHSDGWNAYGGQYGDAYGDGWYAYDDGQYGDAYGDDWYDYDDQYDDAYDDDWYAYDDGQYGDAYDDDWYAYDDGQYGDAYDDDWYAYDDGQCGDAYDDDWYYSDAEPYDGDETYTDEFAYWDIDAYDGILEDMLEANSYETILENNGSYTIETVVNPGFDWYGENSVYCGSREFDFFDYSAKEGTRAEGDLLAILYKGGEVYRLMKDEQGKTAFYVDWLTAPDPSMDSKTAGFNEVYVMTLDAEAILQELVLDVEEHEDGTLTVVTLDNTQRLTDAFGYEASEWKDGLIGTFYELDADTLELYGLTELLLTADGDELTLLEQTVSYGGWENDLLDKMLKKAERYENEAFENPRTVSVIYNPGTEAESFCSRTVEKGDYLYTTFAGDYNYWSDEAGSIPFTGSDCWHDVTIYATPMTEAEVKAEVEPVFEAEPAPEADPAFAGEPVSEAEPASEAESAPETESAPEAEEPEVSSGLWPGQEPEEAAEANLGGRLTGPIAGPMPEQETEMPWADGEGAYPAPWSEDEGIGPDEALPADEIPDVTAIYEEMFRTNSPSALLENHSSAEYRFSYGFEAPDRMDYYYENAEMAYCEGPNEAVYATDSTLYEMILDEVDPELCYIMDFRNGYDRILNAGIDIIPASFEDWFDADAETPVACFEEDGELHVAVEYDSELSRELFENMTESIWTGEIVTEEIVCDAGTYEIKSIVYTLGAGEDSETLMSIEASYDLPEPRAARVLRAAAERYASETADITIIMNPGNDGETALTVTVPIGSTVFWSANEEATLFEDPGCTVPASSWDGISDCILYLMPLSAQI